MERVAKVEHRKEEEHHGHEEVREAKHPAEHRKLLWKLTRIRV